MLKKSYGGKYPTIGKLNVPVEIHTRAEVESGTHSTTETLTKVADAWASFKNIGGITQIDAKATGEPITHRCWIRAGIELTSRHWLVDTNNSKKYNVKPVSLLDERTRFYECVVELTDLPAS